MDKRVALDWFLRRREMCLADKCQSAENVAIEAIQDSIANEPRVMKQEEVDRLEQNEVVWLEDKGIKEVIPAIVVEHSHRYGQQSVCLMILENPRLWIETFDYKERWRCWTQKPTDEQREATPWQGQSS